MEHSKKVQHLFWRAGFGLKPNEFKVKSRFKIPQLVDSLIRQAKSDSKISEKNIRLFSEADRREMSKMERKELRRKGKKLTLQVNAEWVSKMARSGNSAFLEKMTLFWHGHFASETKLPHFATQQLNIFRKYGLGNFRDLVLAVSRDASMIFYLNNKQNKKQSPNENYARELMELFTIGRGNYSEQDIKEAARAFTGWTANFRGQFEFREKWHDYGSKTFMGKTGNFNGEDIVDILLERKETARFIAAKVYRYFVNENINSNHINELADVFYNSNYNIEKLMRAVFESNWFYDSENVGSKIKSPVELIVGVMRTFSVKFNDPLAVVFLQKALGQVLFRPPNVAGWPGGKTWLDNATLMIRLNLVNYLFQATDMDLKVKEEFEAQMRNNRVAKIKAQVNPQMLVDLFKNKKQGEQIESMSEYLLQTQYPINTKLIEKYIIGKSPSDKIKLTALRLMSLPEYQLC